MPTDPLASALKELEVARKLVAKKGNRQIRNQEDRHLLSATAFAWFESHRKHILTTDTDGHRSARSRQL